MNDRLNVVIINWRSRAGVVMVVWVGIVYWGGRFVIARRVGGRLVMRSVGG